MILALFLVGQDLHGKVLHVCKKITVENAISGVLYVYIYKYGIYISAYATEIILSPM